MFNSFLYVYQRVSSNVGKTVPFAPTPTFTQSDWHFLFGGINLPFPGKWVVYDCFTHSKD